VEALSAAFGHSSGHSCSTQLSNNGQALTGSMQLFVIREAFQALCRSPCLQGRQALLGSLDWRGQSAVRSTPITITDRL
jgi:hypothetical protein